MKACTFPSHEDVVCLRCRTPLGHNDVMAKDQYHRSGDYSKRCQKCQLVTSCDLSPAEATAVEYEEPDWRERFETHCARWPKLPRYLQENAAFERTLIDWRRWRAVDDKPAAAIEGMIALAKLKIMPPRNLIRDIERTSACFAEQVDSHMWITMSQRAWRIVAVEDRTLLLDSFGEQTQVDLSRAKWGKYCEKACEVLEAMREKGATPENAKTLEPL